MAEILVKDTSLTVIADAIRSKARTVDPITFPDGFVTVISSLLPDGVVKLAGGTFTPAEKTHTFQFPHGLGITPNFLVFFCLDEHTSATYFYTRGGVIVKAEHILTGVASNDVAAMTWRRQKHATIISDYVNAQWYQNNWDTDVCEAISYKPNDGTSASYYFEAGVTYGWVAGVIENLL